MHHDPSPIGALGGLVVILYVLIRSAFSKATAPKTVTSLNLKRPPKPQAARLPVAGKPIQAVPMVAAAKPVASPPASQTIPERITSSPVGRLATAAVPQVESKPKPPATVRWKLEYVTDIDGPPCPVKSAIPQTEDIPDIGLYAWQAQWKKCLHSSIRGVSHNNDDGSSRQEIIRNCKIGETLDLVRDPDNPFSVNHTAIKILRKHSGEMLGHVSAEISEILADQMDRGAQAEARIIKITGGVSTKRTLGVNIVIGQNYAPRRKKAKAAEEATV